jgi:serine/threonine-protein kinase RsbW
MSEMDAHRPTELPGEPQVTLTIPCAAEYVSTARMTMLGLASRLNISYDEVEDFRTAVGEACTNAIDRYRRQGEQPNGNYPTITLRAFSDTALLALEIVDNVGTFPKGTPAVLEADEIDAQEIGALLMELLVDECSVNEQPDGTTQVLLTKYAATRGS